MNLTYWTVRKGDTAPQTGYVETFSDDIHPNSIIRHDNKSGGWIDHPGPNLKNGAGNPNVGVSTTTAMAIIKIRVCGGEPRPQVFSWGFEGQENFYEIGASGNFRLFRSVNVCSCC